MQMRRFGEDVKTKIAGNHPGLYGVPIAMKRGVIADGRLEEFARKVKGLPIMLEADVQVEAMYFDTQANIEEHTADHDILFLVIEGRGIVRIGGATGETREIGAGEAVLWPAEVEHMVWTEGETMMAIVINV